MIFNKYFILFLVILFSLQSVLAIGITPGRTTLNFEPNLHKEVSFSVINSEHKDMSVVFMVRGELSNSVSLDQSQVDFSSIEESKSFSYSVNLPSQIEKPGMYEVEIVALEVPKGVGQNGATVGATVAVITQLHIYVPYPNKYAEAEVNVIESVGGGETIFSIPVVNRGKLDLVKVKAKIDIFSGSEEKIASIESNSESILSLERKELIAKWPAEVNPGRYKAVVTVIYDEEVTTILKEFNVGEMFLEIKEIVVRDFQLGEIAKFNALVENKWSSNLKDVYLNIIVYNLEGEVMADFKSPNYNIDSLSQKEMISYWDTGGVHEGTYDGKLILQYGEKSTEKNIKLKISDNELEIIGITGQVIVKGKGEINWNTVLIVAVVILIILNIIWFVIIKRFIKK